MIFRILRFVGLTALFTVTACVVWLLVGIVVTFSAEWAAGWSVRQSTQNVVWLSEGFVQVLAQVSLGRLVAPLAWIAAAGAL